jgi:uncharacterized protein YbbC (DUF1343 family)
MLNHSNRLLLGAVLFSAAACRPRENVDVVRPTLQAGPPVASGATPVGMRAGVESFVANVPTALRGKRLGLITNHTGIDRQRTSTIDLLARSPDVKLVALFSPEHGIRGTAAPGEHIESGRDARSGLPVHSLYGATRKPTPEMLEGLDALVFDIQDVGARQYTYVYTMALAMQAAAERRMPFIVLDRPNPVGGQIVEGNILDTAFASFVGMYPIASRHGMTAGELARFFNREAGIGANLTVIRVDGLTRGQWFDDTGLPWVAPSPNLPTLASATHYPGTVFLEGTNLSEGRGSNAPFEQTGAPWLRPNEVIAALNGRNLAGVRFEPVSFAVVPTAAKFGGATLPGIKLIVTDRNAYRPVRTVLTLIDEIRRLHPAEFAWSGSMDRLAGTGRVRQAIEAGTLPALLADWDRDAQRFESIRSPYLLY